MISARALRSVYTLRCLATRARATALVLVATTYATGCGAPKPPSAGPGKVDLPVSDGIGAKEPAPPARQPPPPSGTAKASPFPPVTHASLPNGMEIDVVTARALPIVQVRLLVRAGAGYGTTPGLGEITAHMLKDGGTRSMSSADVVRRVETLGSDLSVRVDDDTSVLEMALTKDKLAEGLAILSEVVREPRFDAAELKKLSSRAIDEAEDAARSNGTFTALWILFHELYPEKSPYRVHGALPSQVEKIGAAGVRAFHRSFYVPKNATLVLAGDVDATSAKELADRYFGAWRGDAPPTIVFPPPEAPSPLRVFVAHRPKSVQSDVFVGMLAPERRSPDWARVRVANQVLGGGVASRLFDDVREKRSLAYRTSAQILELLHGQQPLVLYAGTEAGKTAEAVTGLLENLDRMKTAPPTTPETETARRYLSDIFAVRMETIGAIAEMVVTQRALGLPDGYWDSYRKALRATDAKDVAAVVPTLYQGKRLVIVAGDADAIGQELTRFGDVTIVDPEKEFTTVKTLPKAKSK